MPCPELVHSRGLEFHFDSRRFQMLHPDGRRLITHWFERAWHHRLCEPEDSFEPFIFCWIAFNGWAACCTELDQDRQWLEALSFSAQVCDRFRTTLSSSPEVRQEAERFQ